MPAHTPPTGFDPSCSADPEEMVNEALEGLAAIRRRALHALHRRILSRRVFLYPAAGKLCDKPLLDLEPLRRFSHVCDAFVLVTDFVDEGFTKGTGDLLEALQAEAYGLKLAWGSAPDDVGPSSLHGGLSDLWTTEAPSGAVTEPFRVLAWRFVVHRRVGNIGRELDLLILHLPGENDPVRSAATVYNRMFNFAGTAPRVLCLKGSDPGLRDQFIWDSELGRVIWRGRHHPEFIVTETQPGVHGWLWEELWEVHAGWGEARTYRRPPGLPGHGVVAEAEESAIQGVLPGEGFEDAFGLSFPSYSDRKTNREVEVGRPEVVGEGRRLIARSDSPLLCAQLRELEASCLSRGESTAVVRLDGFEDQGPELTQWRMSADEKFKFVICANTPGAWESFAPFATRHRFR